MSENFPRRLRRGGTVDAHARRVLASDEKDRPSASTEKAMLLALMARLPPSGGAPPSATGGGGSTGGEALRPAFRAGAAKTAASLLGVKALGVVAAGASLILVARAAILPTSSALPLVGHHGVVAIGASPHATSLPALAPQRTAEVEKIITSPSPDVPMLEAASSPEGGRNERRPTSALLAAQTSRDRAPEPILTDTAARADASALPPSAIPVVDARTDPQVTPTGETSPSAPPSVSAAVPPASSANVTTLLREEGRALGAARDALRGGDPARALALLEAARTSFPKALLGQEREALTIEALWSSGRKSEASSRGEDFLRRYPTSPYAARIQSFLH